MSATEGSKNGTGPGGDAASLLSSSNALPNLPDVTAFSMLAKRSLTDALDKVHSAPSWLPLSIPCSYTPGRVRSSAAQIAGAKTLVLDAALAGPLGLVAEMSLLRVSDDLGAALPGCRFTL